MRADGAEPAEVVTDAAELAAVTSVVGTIIADLDRVPNWGPGSRLQVELMTSFHEIRVALAAVDDGLEGPDAADRLAGIPYIATDRMDQAMVQASTAGLDCDGFE